MDYYITPQEGLVQLRADIKSTFSHWRIAVRRRGREHACEDKKGNQNGRQPAEFRFCHEYLCDISAREEEYGLSTTLLAQWGNV